uniref:Uncharacterized protein n=1 Tax=Solanum tuberosum TaxID=4113 RepID=M1DVJ9_SOLTU
MPVVVLGPVATGSRVLDQQAYHGSCEGPRTVKVDVVLHLCWWTSGSGLQTLPWTVVKTTAYERLRGLISGLRDSKSPPREPVHPVMWSMSREGSRGPPLLGNLPFLGAHWKIGRAKGPHGESPSALGEP